MLRCITCKRMFVHDVDALEQHHSPDLTEVCRCHNPKPVSQALYNRAKWMLRNIKASIATRDDVVSKDAFCRGGESQYIDDPQDCVRLVISRFFEHGAIHIAVDSFYESSEQDDMEFGNFDAAKTEVLVRLTGERFSGEWMEVAKLTPQNGVPGSFRRLNSIIEVTMEEVHRFNDVELGAQCVYIERIRRA